MAAISQFLAEFFLALLYKPIKLLQMRAYLYHFSDRGRIDNDSVLRQAIVLLNVTGAFL
jgi:hypothetical protein